MKYLAMLFLLQIFISCSSTLTPAGARVKLMKSDPPANCIEAGNVGGQALTVENVKINMKNQAAEMGANFIRYETEVSGTAFKCP